MTYKARLAVVREAIEVVLRHLECLPPSEKTHELHEWVEDCAHETERCLTAATSVREQDTLMKRVLALHVEVTKLERHALLDIPKGSAASR
jgi:hypothetical protein